MRSPIYLCALAMAPPYYHELPCGGVGIWVCLKHTSAMGSWALYSNDNVVMGPPVAAIGNQCPPMQKPLPVKGLFQPSPATHLEHLANQVPTSSCYVSHND